MEQNTYRQFAMVGDPTPPQPIKALEKVDRSLVTLRGQLRTFNEALGLAEILKDKKEIERTRRLINQTSAMIEQVTDERGHALLVHERELRAESERLQELVDGTEATYRAAVAERERADARLKEAEEAQRRAWQENNGAHTLKEAADRRLSELRTRYAADLAAAETRLPALA